MNKISITVANEKTNTGAKRKVAVFQKASKDGEPEGAIAVSVRSILCLTLSPLNEQPLLRTVCADGSIGRVGLACDFNEAVRALERAVGEVVVFLRRTEDRRALPYALPAADIMSIDVSHKTGEALLKSLKMPDGTVVLAESFDEAVRIWEAA